MMTVAPAPTTRPSAAAAATIGHHFLLRPGIGFSPPASVVSSLAATTLSGLSFAVSSFPGTSLAGLSFAVTGGAESAIMVFVAAISSVAEVGASSAWIDRQIRSSGGVGVSEA
jgi:hypothetical protein